MLAIGTDSEANMLGQTGGASVVHYKQLVISRLSLDRLRWCRYFDLVLRLIFIVLLVVILLYCKGNPDIDLILGQGVRRTSRPDHADHLNRTRIIHFDLELISVVNIVGPFADDR